MCISHTQHLLYLIFKTTFVTRKIKELELKFFTLDAHRAKRLEKQQHRHPPRRGRLGEPGDINTSDAPAISPA